MKKKKCKTTIYQSPFNHVDYAVIKSLEEFRDLAKSEDIESIPDELEKANGVCYFFEDKHDCGTYNLIVVYFHGLTKDNILDKIGVIAHEAVHIWQKIREVMGEESPSSEFEAYSIEKITNDLVEALLKE